MKKFLLYFILLVLSTNAFAVEAESNVRNTHVIIVGVSEYPNLEQNKQLKYADDDADMIYDFWINNGIPKQNISKLVNGDANSTSLNNALQNKLLIESKAGDIVIIYFAGHGDVDEIARKGYLLLNKVEQQSKRPYCINEAISYETIENLISISTKKGVNTMVIVDACRSGSIVSSQQNLNRAMNNLNDAPIGNSAKLLSCGPNEESQEHSQWGDKKYEGHGVFTYYLVNGLKGLADKQNDGIIDFRDIKSYIENQVYEATNGTQTPMAYSYDQKMSLALISEEQKKEAQIEISNKKQSNGTTITTRGLAEDYNHLPENAVKLFNIYDELISNEDFFSESVVYDKKNNNQLKNILLITLSVLTLLYVIFYLKKLKNKNLILVAIILIMGSYLSVSFIPSLNKSNIDLYLSWVEKNKDNINAIQMHSELIEINELEENKHKISGKLLIELNKNINTVLYPLVSGNIDEINKDKIEFAIKCAKEVITIYKNSYYSSHTIGNESNSKDLFLEKYIANKITLETYEFIINDDSTKYKEGLSKIQELKNIDSSSAYVYNVAGIFYEKMNDLDNAKKNTSIAEQKAPFWTEPIVNHGKIYVKENQLDSAEMKFIKALKINAEQAYAKQEIEKINPDYENILYPNESEADLLKEITNKQPKKDQIKMVKEGCLSGNCYSGVGHYVWSDNSSYQGEFHNRMPHGKGKHTDRYGNVIEGEFKKGLVNGYATKTYTSGKTVGGTWENSQLIDEKIIKN
ncbi:MAG: caspase family protein [Flavobacteriales bacterium]|nr:caspase family protein [Flavobacteriales bacterium]